MAQEAVTQIKEAENKAAEIIREAAQKAKLILETAAAKAKEDEAAVLKNAEAEAAAIMENAKKEAEKQSAPILFSAKNETDNILNPDAAKFAATVKAVTERIVSVKWQ